MSIACLCPQLRLIDSILGFLERTGHLSLQLLLVTDRSIRFHLLLLDSVLQLNLVPLLFSTKRLIDLAILS